MHKNIPNSNQPNFTRDISWIFDKNLCFANSFRVRTKNYRQVLLKHLAKTSSGRVRAGGYHQFFFKAQNLTEISNFQYNSIAGSADGFFFLTTNPNKIL